MNKNLETLVNLKVRKTTNDQKFIELREKIERAENDEELESLKSELERLTNEKETIDNEIKAVEDEIAKIDGENQEIIEQERKKIMNLNKEQCVKVITDEERATRIKEVEERAKKLKEGRSITVATGNVLLPNHQSNDLATYPFKEVSNLVDLVKVVNLQGGETYEKAFVKDYGTAGLTTEGADYTVAEPSFGYATISKVKLTAYAEVTEEVLKLPAVDYEAEVLKNVNVALRKKASQQILSGAGTTNTFKGIFATGVEALDAKDDIEISAITNTTLDEILYSYGGDEEVLGTGVLILNKLDLKQFATLRDTEGKKVYEVDYANQTIDGIPYVINSNCAVLSSSDTAAGTFCMAYGVPQGYEMPIFSDVEIAKSTDYKFKQGIVCYKASVFTGGNVGAYRSFVRIKKSA